jgi:hypothetical protein
MRKEPHIEEERLRACLQDQYDLISVVLEFLPLGHDYDGECSLTGMTNAQWKEVGKIFRRIHQIRLPTSAFESLRKERFDPTEYARWIRTFEAQHVQEQSDASASQRALRSSWKAHQPTIDTAVATLEKLAVVLQSQTPPLCHLSRRPACKKSDS